MACDPDGTVSAVAPQRHSSQCAAVTGYFHTGASYTFRCFQRNVLTCIWTSTSLNCGVQCLAAWKFSSNIICLLAWSCNNSMFLCNNGGLTHFTLWSTLVFPGFIAIDNPSQDVTHCYFLCSSAKLTLLQSLNCILGTAWQLSTLTTSISIA